MKRLPIAPQVFIAALLVAWCVPALNPFLWFMILLAKLGFLDS